MKEWWAYANRAIPAKTPARAVPRAARGSLGKGFPAAVLGDTEGAVEAVARYLDRSAIEPTKELVAEAAAVLVGVVATGATVGTVGVAGALKWVEN